MGSPWSSYRTHQAVLRAVWTGWSCAEKELAVLRKGRNAKSGRQPKNMEMIDYRRATGLEALVGYLYLMDKRERLEEIFARLAELIEEETAEI